MAFLTEERAGERGAGEMSEGMRGRADERAGVTCVVPELTYYGKGTCTITRVHVLWP